MDKLGNYVRDTISEMKQVAWPTQTQALLYTVLVIAISLIVAVFVGAFDFLFTMGIDALVNAF